jgi:hypothetical protein
MGIPGCAGEDAHPATDLLRNASDDAGVTDAQTNTPAAGGPVGRGVCVMSCACPCAAVERARMGRWRYIRSPDPPMRVGVAGRRRPDQLGSCRLRECGGTVKRAGNTFGPTPAWIACLVAAVWVVNGLEGPGNAPSGSSSTSSTAAPTTVATVESPTRTTAPDIIGHSAEPNLADRGAERLRPSLSHWRPLPRRLAQRRHGERGLFLA